jgi:carboxyl-terminal processing protease
MFRDTVTVVTPSARGLPSRPGLEPATGLERMVRLPGRAPHHPGFVWQALRGPRGSRAAGAASVSPRPIMVAVMLTASLTSRWAYMVDVTRPVTLKSAASGTYDEFKAALWRFAPPGPHPPVPICGQPGGYLLTGATKIADEFIGGTKKPGVHRRKVATSDTQTCLRVVASLRKARW